MEKIYVTLLFSFMFLFSGTVVQAKSVTKEIKIPAKASKENKFNQPDGEFNYDYMAESENLVLFWAKSFGKNPTMYADKSKRFHPKEILREGERFYNCYSKDLKFVDRKKSHSSKYKMIIWMYNDDQTSAFGWGDEGGRHDVDASLPCPILSLLCIGA